MGYLDMVLDHTQWRVVVVNRVANRYKAPVTENGTGCAKSALSAKSRELPELDAGPGSPALRHRVLQLGEEHGYPALSLGRYRFRKRTTNVGLFAGRWWWQHQTNYFGDTLLDEVVRHLISDTPTGDNAPLSPVASMGEHGG